MASARFITSGKPTPIAPDTRCLVRGENVDFLYLVRLTGEPAIGALVRFHDILENGVGASNHIPFHHARAATARRWRGRSQLGIVGKERAEIVSIVAIHIAKIARLEFFDFLNGK